MYFYILLIRIAALFGHRKARLMIEGQKALDMKKEGLTVNGKNIPRNAIWIHASSVGEFEQARPMIEKLRIQNSKFKIKNSLNHKSKKKAPHGCFLF